MEEDTDYDHGGSDDGNNVEDANNDAGEMEVDLE